MQRTNKKSNRAEISSRAIPVKYVAFIITIVLLISILSISYTIIKYDSSHNTDNTGVYPNELIKVEPGHSYIIGNESAPITIVQFTDYECYFCGKYMSETFPLIKKNYIDTGKVRYAFREFPLRGKNSPSFKAAEAAECSRKQGMFLNYSYILYNRSSEWYNNNSYFSEYAKELGMNVNEFNSCLNNELYKLKVLDDMNAGIAYGVTGTPTLFINGTRIYGAYPYKTFKDIIDKELNETNISK